jgi:hypothetical protein
VAWLKLLALDDDLAKAAPKTLRTGSCPPPPRGTQGDAARQPGRCHIRKGDLLLVGVQRLLEGGQKRSSGQAENYAC